ncbi:MAG TPA: hypothetical protein PK986_09215 [Spirochaetota bacterium]|mgnify:CR=1 FL=1|nr:hypothetical protein [Spirochaetota bacterium]
MKKIFFAFFCILVAMSAVSSASEDENYGDAVVLLEQLISIQKEYIHALKKANKDDEIISAVNSFGDSLITLHPKIIAVNKKYPEIRSLNKVPEKIFLLLESSKQYNKKIHDMTLLVVYRFSYNENIKKTIDKMHSRLVSYEN